MNRYNKLYEASSIVNINGVWYHGDINHRMSFADQRMQSSNFNAVGPGIYFTSDKNQALGYAHPNGWVYTCKVNGKFITDKKTATLKEIRTFLKLLDNEDLETLLSNYDENPVLAQRKLENFNVGLNFVDCFADLGQSTDFRSEGRVWASLMVKLGYSGVFHKPNEKYYPETSHLIVWDPSTITIMKEESRASLTNET